MGLPQRKRGDVPLGIAGIFCSGRLGSGLGVVDASIVA